jgi:FPC/CPF motif-containing protein YcgG
MNSPDNNMVVEEYFSFIREKNFPCIAAKTAEASNQIQAMVAGLINSPRDDKEILLFLYAFIDRCALLKNLYHSAAVIFKDPQKTNEETFDLFLWQRLQALSDLDARYHRWDSRVSNDPSSPDFSFSIKENAFYIIGLHPGSSRPARRFRYPTLVFNLHEQFETLRALHKYETMKQAVRKRDMKLAGSINPMLSDFGETSEAYQYSGRLYTKSWKCPFHSHHETNKHHSPT